MANFLGMPYTGYRYILQIILILYFIIV